jgi:hypothetical protein
VLVPAAATAAGLPKSSIDALLLALPQGPAALDKVPGITTKIAVAAGKAFQQAYVHGIKITALSSLSFGIIGIIACVCCENIDHKFNKKIEVFLENDTNADKNRYH